MLDSNAIMAQSKAAYNQWHKQWREHATAHSKFKQKSFDEFFNIGVGKAVLCVANGYSFEEEIETIQKYQNKVDIMCCDKTLGHLIENGIKPDYCVVADANVDYEKYMEKWKGHLDQTVLFMNVQANPKWSHNGNWKDIVFFANEDIIKSHLEFMKLSGCPNVVPAGTNVSNAMVIILTQSNNEARRNAFGYDKILLIGYDYSWKHGGKYYAFDELGGGKYHFMTHNYAIAPDGEFVYTSGNLAFSMEWLRGYVTTFKLPVVQCSKSSILTLNGKPRDLAEQMQYGFKTEDRKRVRDSLQELQKLKAREQQLVNTINNIGRDHYWSYVRTT